MPATKSLSTIIAAGTSNAAAGTTTGTSVNLTTAYGALVTIKLTNGATGPTVAATAYVMVSGDGANWKEFYRIAGTTTANDVREWAIDIPLPAMYVNVIVKDNTVQPVTCEAFAQVATGV